MAKGPPATPKRTTRQPIRGRRSRPTRRPAMHPVRDPLVPSSYDLGGQTASTYSEISSCRRTNGRLRSRPCRNPSYSPLRQRIRGGSTASAAGARMADPSSITSRFISRRARELHVLCDQNFVREISYTVRNAAGTSTDSTLLGGSMNSVRHATKSLRIPLALFAVSLLAMAGIAIPAGARRHPLQRL